jgi:hypothetical protein
MMWRSGG